jgi:hypothetical protein
VDARGADGERARLPRSAHQHVRSARAVGGPEPFASLRAFFLAPKVSLSASETLDLDQLELVTLTPTAVVCPPFTRSSVPASGGDVRVPIELANPGKTSRRYRVFVSSFLGVDRQTLEMAVHETDDSKAADNVQRSVGADGGFGAVELFASDAAGNPSGASIVAAGGEGIEVAAGQTWRGVVVHHVTPAMLGPSQSVALGARNYTVRRDTLLTSVVFWDPNEPRVSDAGTVVVNGGVDVAHHPPGFGPLPSIAPGWGSADIPSDQVGGYYVSVLTLTP